MIESWQGEVRACLLLQKSVGSVLKPKSHLVQSFELEYCLDLLQNKALFL